MDNKKLIEYKKQHYCVTITRVKGGLCIYNKLDDSNCTTTDDRCFVVTGKKGEQWPIRQKDLKKYLNIDGTRINPDEMPLCEPVQVQTDTSGPHILAYIATEREEFPAPASWQMEEPLVAMPGDAVAFTMNSDGTPNAGDKYRIEAEVFADTYEAVQ